MSLIEAAVEALARGKIVGVPTDTVYGLAVDPWNEAAIAALYEAKGRPEHKPIGLLAATADQAGEVGELSPAVGLLGHWPGALTVVVRTRVMVPNWVGDSVVGTVGIRVPDQRELRALLTHTGPLAVTSANLSGGPAALDDGSAQRVFGERVAVYLPGVCPGGTASTVVDVTGDQPRVLRKGPVVIAEGD